MLIPLPQLAEDRPGRLALITLAVLTPVAIVASILISLSGATLGQSVQTALLVYGMGSVLLAAPAMFGGIFLLVIAPSKGIGRSLMIYGAAMGALGFSALALI